MSSFILAVLICFAIPAAASAQDFTITDFADNIVINNDSSFTVKETITVEFHRPRHGIYREIPYIYKDSFGSTIRTPLKVISVTNSAGAKLTSKISLEGNIIKVRIGDADKYISGSQTYEIFYKVENALLFFDDHDELYWNVTGNFWNAEIKKASANVTLAGKNLFSSNPENIRNIYSIAGLAVSIISAFLLVSVLGDITGTARSLIAGVLAGLPILSFAKYMPAKTRAGSSLYMDVLGFQEFLNRAEKDRLERMKDENLFSKYFPYALALNVADNWAKAFEGIYQQPPEWYVSPVGMRTFNPVGFTHSVNSAMSNLSSAMFSAPRGSGISGGGSGGGGFSGGGFGGGGGGSW